MKCPRCGHWNKPTFPRCFKCGEPLSINEKESPAWKEQFDKPAKAPVHVVYDDAAPVKEDILPETPAKTDENLADEMVRLRERRARGNTYLEEFRKNAAEQGLAPSGSGVSIRRGGSFFDAVPDDPSKTVLSPHAARAVPDNLLADLMEEDASFLPLEADPEAEAEFSDVDLPPAYDAPQPLAPRRIKRRRSRVRGPMAAAIWTVRILVLSAAMFLVWQGVLLVKARTQSAPVVEAVSEAFIEPIEIDGYAGHRILLPGAEGSKVYISELNKSFVVIGGAATIEVADYTFYDTITNLDVDQMEVTLTPTMIHNGEETRLAAIRYTIDIPLSPVKLISPDTTWVQVSTSIYNMELQVTPGSKVSINGQDYTDTVDNYGRVTANPPVKAIGDNIVTVTVRAPHCRENNLAITFYREPQEITLELDAATVMETSKKDFQITATTLPGATITFETPVSVFDSSKLEETGEFTFWATMQKTGYNTVRIRASYPGKADSILEHTVYYLPTVDVYSPLAWTFTAKDYSDLLNNIALRTENAQIYRCDGTIKEILSQQPQLAIMDTGTDGKEQLVMLQNESSQVWELGKAYRVYADVSGLYGDIPRMIVRYSYDP